MSDTPFPQPEACYPPLDVLSVDPTNPFQLSPLHETNTNDKTPASDPSPIDSQPQWDGTPTSDLFSRGAPLNLEGTWAQSHSDSQSSADQFWNPGTNIQRPLGQFESRYALSSFDIDQAMAGIAAAAPQQHQHQQPQDTYHPPTPTLDVFNVNQATYNYPQSGLFSNPPNLSENDQLHQALSRHSSYSSFTSLSNDGFTSTSNEGLFDQSRNFGHGNTIQLLPPFQPVPRSNTSRPTLPPIQVNAFSTPGKMGRPRSTSRITPYSRHGRSTSISTVGSFDGVPPFSASTYSSFQPPSLASPPRGLAQGMGKMSLHHRRTSSKNSNYGTVKKQSSRSVLARSNRSASMSVLRATNTVPFDFSDTKPTINLHHHSEAEISESLLQQALDVRGIASPAQQDKARAQWVKYWLQISYTSAPGCTVPRQGMHYAYRLASESYGLAPINAASFGKAVRAAYPGIKNRRLGHRGNSKYHFVSIRPALAIEAQRLNEYGEHNGVWQKAPNGTIYFMPTDGLTSMDMEEDDEVDHDDFEDNEDEAGDTFPIKKSASSLALSHAVRSHRQSGSDDYTPRREAVRPRLGMLRRHTTSIAPSPPSLIQRSREPTIRLHELDDFPSWEDVVAACPNQSETELRAFWQGFEQHQQDLVQCIERQAFDEYENICRQYWFPARYAQQCDDEDLSRLVHQAMAVTFDHIISVLLKSSDLMDGSSCESLQELASALEETMETGFSHYSLDFKTDKLVLIRNAAHLMQRVSETSQIVTALKSPSNGNIASKMASTWHTLDFQTIVDQCLLSSTCDAGIIQQVMRDFGTWLDVTAEGMRPSGQLAFRAIKKMTLWLDTIIDHFVQEGSIHSLPTKCTFLTSQISRAIILKSDANFGTFQLLKTYIDDYITIAAARHQVFSINKSHDEVGEIDQSPHFQYHQGLSVEIPRLGDGTFGSDPATAVPTYRTQQHSQNIVSDGHVDPALLNDYQSTSAGMVNNMAAFDFLNQQINLQNNDPMIMDQFLPKIEQ